MRRICYLILAHADPKHFEKLVNAIDYKARFFVHVDAKTDIRDFQTLSLPDTLAFIKDRVCVSWGGISMIDATLRLIEHALNSEEEFTHFVLLSGADYPIKKSSFIYETLSNNPEHQFIKFIDMRESSHYINHVNIKWFKEPIVQTSNKIVRLIDKIVRNLGNRLKFHNSWDKSIIPYFGSQWWAITPCCAKYILDFIKRNPEYYIQNKFTFAPDEHFFHTIVGNSTYNEKSDGTHKYEGRGTWRMANLHLIDPSLTKWYSIKDWDKIKSSDKLFVRKLNSFVSDELTKMIDEKCLKPTV